MMNEKLKSKLEEVKSVGVSDDICNKIMEYIESADDARLHWISPFRIADEWGMERNEVLNAFLYSSKAGIFDLEWNIKCPSCKAATESTKTLSELTSTSHCEHCRIDVDAGFDDAVEVTFNINRGIKNIGDIDTMEIGSAWMEHEETISFEIENGESHHMGMCLENGTYYVICPSTHSGQPIVIDDDGKECSEVSIIYDDSDLRRDNSDKYKSGRVHFNIKNNSDSPQEFIFVKAKDFPWVSGADIASNQLFRDYFSTELISKDEMFAIKNMVFVFTDIKGSTDLYEKRGDSKAYYLVKEHFRIMNRIVAKYNGAVVKTIGDAVMATFVTSEESIKAVFEMQQEFDKFNMKEQSRDDIIIKIGMHRGGCLAVTSNDRLDYFGRTVNIAARVQGLSGGDDIMISKTLYDEPGVKELVESYSWQQREIDATLKGIEGLYEVVHVYK